MAGFGDNTTCFQRGGVIPTGGIRVECGCYTAIGDTTLYIPTQFTKCFAVLANDDVSGVVTSIPDVSSGYIKATLRNTGSGGTFNYVAFGI